MADEWGMEPWMYSPDVQYNTNGQMVAPTPPIKTFADYIPQTSYGGQLTKTNSYLQDLTAKKGGSLDFWPQALQAYFDRTGSNSGDSSWWGDEAMLRAHLQGASYLDPGKYGTAWTDYSSAPGYNRATETAQQAQSAAFGQNQQANSDPDFDLGQLTPFIVAAGAGALGAGGLFGGAGGAAGGASSLPSALSGAGSFEAGLGSTLGGNAGLGISGSLGSSAGGVLGGAGSFADIAAGGALGGIGGAAGIGALPSIGAGSVGGVGNVAGGDVIASGTGGGGDVGDWDFMDLLDGGDSALPGGTNPYGGDLGLPNGTLPDGSVDVGASWQNQLQAALNGMPNMPPGLSSAIKALAGGSGGSSLLSLLGKAGGGVLDYMSTSKAADNAKEIADRTWGAGQQYRDNASRAMTPGFDLNSIPGYSGALSTGMDVFNRSLSAKNGNPWGQGGAAGEAISWAGKTIGLPAWQNYFNSNSNAGGLSNLATQSTTAGLNAGAADAATYGSLGQTARNIFDPQPNYQKQYLDLLGKQYGLA